MITFFCGAPTATRSAEVEIPAEHDHETGRLLLARRISASVETSAVRRKDSWGGESISAAQNGR